MIASPDIKNQTIESWDIASGGVASSEIRNQSIKSWDIARGGVGTSEIRNGSIIESDVDADFLSSLNGAKGAPRPARSNGR